MLRQFVCFTLLYLTCVSIPVNAQSSDSAWCTTKVADTVQSKAYTSCGWFGWGSCSVITYRTVYKTIQTCCPGYAEPDCTKIPEETEEEAVTSCPYSNPKIASVCSDGTRLCRDKICDESGFQDPVVSVSIHENNNDEQLLWSTNGTSFVRYKIGKKRKRYSANVPSTQCEVTSTNEIAEVRDGTKIYRKKCTNTLCNVCGINDEGCLDNDVEYSVEVTCFAPGYNINTGKITHTFTLIAEKAEKLEFHLPEELSDHSLNLLTSEVKEGEEILTLADLQIPANDHVIFYLHGPPSVNNRLQPLFNLSWDEATRSLHVFAEVDLTVEPEGTHPVQLCAWQRRDTTCHSFNVTLVHLTTTTTTTSTTTTTTATTTTTPEQTFFCRARDAWAKNDGNHKWCHLMCSIIDCENIYPDFCVCEDYAYVHKVCKSEGSWKSKTIDDWCMLNCNYSQYSFCPSQDDFPDGYCVCEEQSTPSSVTSSVSPPLKR